MRYYVTLAGRTFEVELAAEGLRVDGRTLDGELRRIPGTPLHHLILKGRSHALVASPEARGRWRLQVNGTTWSVEVVDERTRAIREMTGGGAGPQGPRPVKAPMPGLVVRVAVGPGERVEAGQGVVIIEAMKMENELKADAGGVVARVRVEAGQPVEKGAVLVEFETPDGEG